ncbi:MAG: transposase [Thermodesulfobacteriota bacterium]
MAVADAGGLPLAVYVASASPHEVTLVEQTLDAAFTNEIPARVIGDKAYDSDGLDQRLREEWGAEMIAPHRAGRKRPRTQDGRPLRRYRRRWKIERLFAWLQNFMRLVVRYERHVENFLAAGLPPCPASPPAQHLLCLALCADAPLRIGELDVNHFMPEQLSSSQSWLAGHPGGALGRRGEGGREREGVPLRVLAVVRHAAPRPGRGVRGGPGLPAPPWVGSHRAGRGGLRRRRGGGGACRFGVG